MCGVRWQPRKLSGDTALVLADASGMLGIPPRLLIFVDPCIIPCAMKSESSVDSPVKVHIVLKKDVCPDSSACQEALRTIQNVSGIANVNQKRLERYGIVSGDLPKSKIESVRELPHV